MNVLNICSIGSNGLEEIDVLSNEQDWPSPTMNANVIGCTNDLDPSPIDCCGNDFVV
jgi:hypothetical protein